MSQEDLGAKADLHYTYIGAVERGEKNCSVKTLEKIADGLNTNLSDLVNVSRKPKQNQKIKESLINDLAEKKGAGHGFGYPGPAHRLFGNPLGLREKG